MKKYLIFLSLFILLFLVVFRDLYVNITTNLLDWRDFPASAWLIDQNLTKILTLNFHNFFDTNIYYPHKYTLLFADTTLPQALLALMPFFFTKNLIFSFNIMFLLIFILNFSCAYLFWRQIFKKSLIAFFGSLFSIFSPFFYLELGHLPDLTFWPFFLTLYLLFKQEEKKERNIKTLILIGLGITTQFLANVYLSAYLIFSIFIFYLLKLTRLRNFKMIIYQIFIIFLVFFSTSGVFIKGYIDMKDTYHAERNIREYIIYSADLSDYLFSASINSVVHRSPLMNSWNKFNKSGSNLFPGFLITILAVLVLFKIQKSKQSFFIALELNKQRSYFFILMLAGLIFSLGPRLNFNGNYAEIPLPYGILLKYVPLADAMRVLMRWSFLFFLGLTYFSLISLDRLTNKSYYKEAFLLVFIVFILEYIPFNLKSAKNSYITPDYQFLKNECSNDKKVLLELPLTHLDAGTNIREGLSYITTSVLASAYHRCFLINGYSAFDLPENFTLSATLSQYIIEDNVKAFIAEMQKRQIDIVKFNQPYFIKELKPFTDKFVNSMTTENAVEKINENLFYINKN